MKIKAILFLLFLTAAIQSLSSQVYAQSDINLTVSPPISYLQVPPGTTRQHTIILENKSNKAISVIPSIVDFSADGETGKAIISNELSFPYITFGANNIKELSIPAHKKAQLTLYIDVPQNAIEKEYPLTILFSSKENKNQFSINSTSSKIAGAIGSNLVVLVSKENKLNQVLTVLKLNTPRIIDSFGKIEFAPLVKNESIASVAASGSAKILNFNKKPIAKFEVYPDIILGSSTRKLRAWDNATLSEGNLDLNKQKTGTFSYKPKFLFGPYQVVIELKTGSATGLENTSQYVEVVYALPFSLIIITAIGVSIGVIYYRKIKNNANPESKSP